MVRKKLAVAIAALGALQADVASALGLGEFTLQSALNQPLQAEIRLLNTSDLDDAQVRIALAGREDFKAAGVSRDFFLTNFKFNVEMDGQGSGVIKITTREPVIEPYLDFLIEARWPNGRLLREYTVLLDLPVFSESGSQQPAVATSSNQTSAPAIASTTAPTATRSAATSSSNRTSSARRSPVSGDLAAGEEYRVGTNDTLWEIAARGRPAGASVQQTMVGIQRINPDAFVNGNINRLKAGSVLRLPKADEISGISEREAVGEVANQNQAWRSGQDGSMPASGAQLDATAKSSSSDTGSAEQPRLSIATGGDSDRASVGDGDGSGVGAQALQNELDESQENLDKTRRENEELQSRLSDMEAKMATLQRLLEVKDDQLAALQGDVASQTDTSPDITDDTADTESDSELASEPAAAAPGSAAVAKPEKPAEPTQQAPVQQPKQTPAEPELLDQLLGNPLYLGGAGLLALALVLVLMRRRKAADEDDDVATFELTDQDEGIDEEPLIDFSMDEDVENTDVSESEQLDATEQLVAELEQELSADNEAALAESESETEQAAVSTMQSETGDAIAEADIYVAYGRYQQAIDLLRSAIAEEPQRSDLQVKLLEVYIETRDKPSFQQQYLTLQALGDDNAITDVKEMLSSVDGVADWLENLPGAGADFSDADMDADLIEGDADLDLGGDLDASGSDTSETDNSDLDLGGDVDLDGDIDLSDDLDLDGDLDLNLDEELEIDLDLDAMGKTQENDAVSGAGIELDDELNLSEDLDLGGEQDASLDKTMQFDAVTADDALDDLNLDEDLDLDFELDNDAVELSGADLDLDGAVDETPAALSEVDLTETDPAEAGSAEAESTEEGFDLDLDGDLDLDMGDLGDADLSDLEAEFDGAPGALNSEVSGDQIDDLSNGQQEDANVDESLPLDSDLTVEFSATDAAADQNESFDTASAADAGDDFDFLADTDEVATKLDLARAYIDMGDTEGAKDILDEVVQEGNDEQKQEASELMERVD